MLAYSKVFDHIRVVIRPEDDRLADRLKNFNVELIKSENAKYGMGYSLSDGIIDTLQTGHLSDYSICHTSKLLRFKHLKNGHRCRPY